MNPALLPPNLGWRLAFGLGALASIAVMLVWRTVPESPRWLVRAGRAEEARQIVERLERSAISEGHVLEEPEVRSARAIEHRRTFFEVARLMVARYRRRAVFCLVLMATQAFFYNAIYFSYALVLTRFYDVAPDRVGTFIVPFALGNFLGPLALGKLFDAIGWRPLIVSTYALSGALLALTGWLFAQGALTPVTQTLMWSATFFFGSAAASSAYLSASELFPLEVRGKAIARFYATGTGLGGLVAPALFGALVQSGASSAVFHGYLVGAGLMIFAAIVAFFLAERAERRSLESLAL